MVTFVESLTTIIAIHVAFTHIARGHRFPLDIPLLGVGRAIAFTPFPYQLYFPVSIYMGKTAGLDLARGLLIQICWVTAAYGLARFAWNRGIRKYSAVGG